MMGPDPTTEAGLAEPYLSVMEALVNGSEGEGHPSAFDIAQLVSLQLRVLYFCLLQNGNVRIGVFPEGQEFLVGGSGFGCIALEGIGAAKT